jgi:hypothetical protein
VIENKNVLIITDDSKETAKMAAGIAAALEGNQVSIKSVAEFMGNDILPADTFFLGCEKPNQDSFSYLADLLMHINLAGRPCGVFSPGSKTATEYLAGLVFDSEAALNPDPFLASSETEIRSWSQNVIAKSF